MTEARSNEFFADVCRVGIDETSRKRGHHYVSLFVDIDQSKVIFATEGKGSDTVGRFSNDFHDHGGDTYFVREACCDMSPAFIKGIEQCLPNAEITFDRFHVMKIIGDAVDKVRRLEQEESNELKGSRYAWLKNPENLTIKQRDIIDTLSNKHRKQPALTEYDLVYATFGNNRNQRQRITLNDGISGQLTVVWKRSSKLRILLNVTGMAS